MGFEHRIGFEASEYNFYRHLVIRHLIIENNKNKSTLHAGKVTAGKVEVGDLKTRKCWQYHSPGQSIFLAFSMFTASPWQARGWRVEHLECPLQPR